MRMHPVERWTTLVDVGRRGAYLIEKPLVPVASASASTSGRRLGSADAKVNFSADATASHAQLCAVLPYPARLQLCLSLLMWVRCLRDVQDTLARVRLPYAAVRRPQRYAVADVYPTRLSEYWVDVHTTVSTKMHAQLNSTAEQVPAPHTWDVETAETIEDAATESTITVDSGRVLHGRHAQRRLSGKALLQQVQGVQPRASADDALAAQLTRGSTEGGRRRRRHRRLLHAGGQSAAAALAGPSALSTDTAADTNAPSPPRRGNASGEFLPDAARRVAPVSLELQPVEDAVYHGNTRRGEGCPISEDGESTPNPIYIHVPPCAEGKVGESEAEAVLRHCVMAHAAVFSSLFIEGRVVDFSTNNAAVAAYVQWLLEDFVSNQFVRVSLIDAAEKSAASYRPYFPAWCWRNVLVVLPPRNRPQRGARGVKAVGYSTALIMDWAARIVQAAPCAVMVEGGAAAATGGYARQLKDAVQHLQQGRKSNTDEADVRSSPGAPSSMTAAHTTVEWVPIVTSDSAADAALLDSEDRSVGAKTASFQPLRTAASPRWSFSPLAAGLRFLSHRSRTEAGNSEADAAAAAAAQYARRQEHFLHAVQETLQDRFYLCEFLYSPTQSCLTPYRFERWVWEQLPDNVRVVGVNTSPLDVLFYFPQGVFLTQKVGNAFRYRAVDRTVVAKDLVPSWSSHPLRHTATQLKRLRRRWWPRRSGDDGDVADGLHAELSLADRRELRRAADDENKASATPPVSVASCQTTPPLAATEPDREAASQALVRERTVEYLAEPSKWTLLGLATARFFRV